jgi:hypothetical protein
MLKYYFDVEYTDGTFYTQNKDDRSLIDPEKRSCFYDVMQDIEKGKQVKTFLLSDGVDAYSVDLTDGHFEVNGKPFFMHDSGMGLKNFRLIFYRQHTHQFNMQQQELSHFINYCIGWQTNDETGKNYKRIMELK